MKICMGALTIENLTKRVTSSIGTLRRMRSFVPPQTLRLIFNALVRPHFDYCSGFWEKLRNLQNRAARILTVSSYDFNVDHLLSKLGWRILCVKCKNLLWHSNL